MPRPVITICIVDDDDSVRRSLSRLLRSAGYDVRAFSTIGELLASEQLHRASCVIADVRMPGGSGLELPDKLRARGVSIPVLIVTAHDTEEMRTEARRAGVSAYFRKPVDDQALIDAIEWAVSRKTAVRDNSPTEPGSDPGNPGVPAAHPSTIKNPA